MPPSINGAALAATEVFRNEFHGYQKMADSDYLEHSLLFGSVQDFLKQQNKPLRVLDLGCGDAGNLSKVLANISGCIASYTGVDMSDSALQSARKNIQGSLGADFPAFFHTSDMLSFLKQTYASYDIVLAAFALHHLPSEEKKLTMKEIQKSLSKDGGVFIMVDPFRKPGEDLKAYRQRATEVGETWVAMGKEQQDNFIKHMQDYDIVEEEAFFDEALREAGFSDKKIVCQGKIGLQSNVVIFHK